jgi:1-acyl-sn-glycerol-3-phosphate acyltransferase
MFSTHTEYEKATTVRRVHFVTPAVLQGIAWPLGRFAVDFFVRLRINGTENLKEAIRRSKETGTGVIFAVNHTSELDFLFPLVAIPPGSRLFPMFYVTHARSQYLNKADFGWRRHLYGFPAFLKAWGAHPYVADQHDYAKSLGYHQKILKLGKSVCIFPEGKIQKGPNEKRAHGGVAYLAEATGATIIPIAVSGASKMTAGEFLLRKRNLHISYGVPLVAADIIDISLPTPDRHQQAAEKIMDIIDKMRAFHHRDKEASY